MKNNMQIIIQARDMNPSLLVELASGEALLVGRTPDPSHLTEAQLKGLHGELRSYRLKTLRVELPRVSSNHLLLALPANSETVSICDLGSRNGSWLRLAAQQPVYVGANELIVALAQYGDQAEANLTNPEDPTWSNERDFGVAMVHSLREWLARLGMQADVQVRSKKGDPGAGSFALADDTLLFVTTPPGSTQEPRWPQVLDRVRSYVHEHNARLELYLHRSEGMIVASRPLRDVLRRLADAARHGRRTILLGPSGVGKEGLARSYHRYSQRDSGPFAALNCALLDRELLFAQLFGARKGSFTGAVVDIVGVVEAAHGGTLFLDELGEMTLDVQKALLRFLDSHGEYQRLGDPGVRRVNVQIVCATNALLDDPMRRIGQFRDDLWYRLASAVINVPPLCERREDVLAYLQTRTTRNGLRIADAMSPSALERALADPWPGNFRDLENFVDRLPSAPAPHSISFEVCDAALSEGRGSRRSSEDRLSITSLRDEKLGRKPRSSEHPADKLSPCLREAVHSATEAFLQDRGNAQADWGTFQEFIEKYLRPTFVARACDLNVLIEQGKPLNYSSLARRLNVADGSTIKMHLNRYIERFGHSGETK